MSQGSEAVTIRLLPDGDVQPARIEAREHDQLVVCLPGEGARLKFEAGALIEIQSDKTIYLGVVLHRQDSRLAVSVEHAVNRAAVAEIGDAWRE